MKATSAPLIACFVITASLLASFAAAQSPAQYSDVPDRFRLELGGFRLGSDTDLTFNTSGVSTPINFEGLNLPDSTTQFYIEGFWRPGRRHQLSLSWYRNNREGDPKTVERDFAWGNRVVTAGAVVTARVSSHYLSGAYRFAAYKNDRFEIGPSLGIGHLSLEGGIAGQVSASGGVSEPFDISRSLGQPTGDVGGYLYWWPIRRLLIRGDMRYIIVKPEHSEASITDGRGAAIYHLWAHVGLGVQYTYTKFRYDRDILSADLGGRIRYSGVQLVFSGAF